MIANSIWIGNEVTEYRISYNQNKKMSVFATFDEITNLSNYSYSNMSSDEVVDKYK